MARRTPTYSAQSKLSNPLAHVGFQPSDLSGIEVKGGGVKELVEVTADLRRVLQNEVTKASEEISIEMSEYPEIPSVLVMSLRDVAIAKSHRPLTLAHEAGMPSAGHGYVNEMLVAANQVTIEHLNEVIQNRNTKSIRANLSAIEHFETWGVQRRLPKQFRGKDISLVYEDFLDLKRRLIVKLFNHQSSNTTQMVVERTSQLLFDLNVHHHQLSQRVGPPLFVLEFNDKLTEEIFLKIVRFQGIKGVMPEPYIWPSNNSEVMPASNAPRIIGPGNESPVVAVCDTGVVPGEGVLTPWISSRDTYVLPPDTNYVHGTQVSSLVVDGFGLNLEHALFPQTSCFVHDVCLLEIHNAKVTDLIVRLREAIPKAPHVKIWNLSLGGDPIADDEFSEFAKELDSLSDAYNILFVVASGNYSGQPRRSWPTDGSILTDRISIPGDSVRALTVGAITHLSSDDALVGIGMPAPYSRRGPGPVFTPKPDIVHIGGNINADLSSTNIGVNVLNPNGEFGHGCGTSFAAPIASSMAAHAWKNLEASSHSHSLNVTPSMIKALMIHSAQLASPDRSPIERRYFGAGIPKDITSVLYDSDSSFTMLFELDIVDATKWRKSPFPIPAALMENGKLKGEVIITAVYAPPLDSSAGSEYVRVNVDIGFGTLSPDEEGRLQFKGQVPMEGEIGTTGYEDAQVEYGGKWSPVKIYRKKFSQGKTGNIWALQASLVRRAFEPQLAQPLRVVILVTLRALDGNSNVYEDGRRALAATNWISQDLVNRIQVPV
ncbi:S8 family anti-phage peptidase IteS [Polynucleobacter sphagniphilus]|uniref:Serine protease AprX n=1 Tax=Polynucleobacter sphagniphilus TaxID=1743169 RepID=A0AA43M6J5_9BURK|nr:S8 family anti-phage peptidase IteS [Polynucleobacter sphagniphilus]MDH6503068.1 serine protease AprX [Polynucleobacter sphagniphilus]MDH6511729.1 serine protease AprX [Polynucleobacter sphagniphilus]OLY96648.1 peptidase [Polynucleobacter sphagniphilus]